MFLRTLSINKKSLIFAVLSCMCSHAFADAEINTSQYIDKDNIRVQKAIKTNPIVGTRLEYMKTKDSLGKLAQQAESKTVEMPDVVPNGLKPVSQQSEVKQPIPAELIMPKSKVVTKADGDTQKNKTLLDKIKSRKRLETIKNQKRTLNANKKVNEQLKLTPREERIILPDTKNQALSKRQKKVRKAEDAIINRLEFTQANMLDVARALADISGLNFVATEQASKKNITVFLQNISVKDALEIVTKNSGLWYRRDKGSGAFRIMTTQEYQRDLIVYREDTTRVFRLLHPNPILIATSIRDLYGNRVILSMGAIDNTFMPRMSANGGGVARRQVRGANSQGRAGGNLLRRNNTNQRGQTSSSQMAIQRGLSADQLEKLDTKLKESGGDTLTADALKGINKREQPIYIALNQEHDLMIVRTSDNSVMNDIEQLVHQLDRPVKQVLLEMKILSLDVGDAYRQSMDLDYMPSSEAQRGPFTDQDRNPLLSESPIQTTTTGTTTNPDGSTSTQTQSGSFTLGVRNILGLGNFALEGGTFVYQFLNDKIRARIQLLQQNNRINTISSPILLTSNNKPSRVFVGTEQVITTGFEAVAGATNGLAVSNPAIIPITEIRNIGNTLQVMPKINADKTVTLLIQQDSSSLVRGASTIPIPVGNSVQSFNVDSVRTSNINGTVQAKDGLTIAIGGLIDSTDSEEEQKIPVLGDFPILGDLFKRKVQQKGKRELLLLITPHIIETPHDAEDGTRDAVEPISDQEW